MPLTVKSRLSMPMVIALLILAGGFIAIAWTVQWATAASADRIEQATTAGAAIVSMPALANNVAGSLPAFTLDLDGATAYQPQLVNGGVDPQDLTKVTVGVSAFVWLNGMQWNCSFITDDYAYQPVGVTAEVPPVGQDVIDIARWNKLTFRQQQNVKEACK